MPPASRNDIDRILEAIRTEAKARGSKARVGAFSTEMPGPAGAVVQVAAYGLPALPSTHVADYLALPLDAFLGEAYRGALGRDPDPSGAAHYQRKLLRGALTRIEVLGRLSFSPEGRRSRCSVPGLLPAFLLATAYRLLPVVGPALALVARALNFPAHWQDRKAIESAAIATGSWMKR